MAAEIGWFLVFGNGTERRHPGPAGQRGTCSGSSVVTSKQRSSYPLLVAR